MIPDKRKRRYPLAEVGYLLTLLIVILLSLSLFFSFPPSPSRSLSHPRSLRSSRPVDSPVDSHRDHHPAPFKASSLLIRRSLISLPKPVRRTRSSFILILSNLVLFLRASDSRRSFGVLWTLFVFQDSQDCPHTFVLILRLPTRFIITPLHTFILNVLPLQPNSGRSSVWTRSHRLSISVRPLSILILNPRSF